MKMMQYDLDQSPEPFLERKILINFYSGCWKLKIRKGKVAKKGYLCKVLSKGEVSLLSAGFTSNADSWCYTESIFFFLIH